MTKNVHQWSHVMPIPTSIESQFWKEVSHGVHVDYPEPPQVIALARDQEEHIPEADNVSHASTEY